MKTLLKVISAFEGLTGIGLLFAPSLVVSILLGASLDGPATILLSRITGTALISLAIICWLSSAGSNAREVVIAMLFYNVVATGLLLYAVLGVALSGIGIWPAVLTHAGLSLWCALSFRK